jgi:hypothetical protein
MKPLALLLLAATAHNLGRIADELAAWRYQQARPERGTATKPAPSFLHTVSGSNTFGGAPPVTWIGANGERHTYGVTGAGAR